MLYRMYIDECGTDDIVSCEIPQHRHLALTGVIISHDDVINIATPGLNKLKDRFFPKDDPDAERTVLHRSDFLAAKGDFHALGDPAIFREFEDALHQYLSALPHWVITVVIDKYAMLKNDHWKLKEPYHLGAGVLAEKFVQFLDRKNARGDIYAESRKHKKNTALASHLTQACERGTLFVPNPERFKKRLTTFEIEFREKKHNNTGLQIADIYAKPSFDRIMHGRDKYHKRSPFSIRFGALLFDRKYDRSQDGVQRGYGMKFMP